MRGAVRIGAWTGVDLASGPDVTVGFAIRHPETPAARTTRLRQTFQSAADNQLAAALADTERLVDAQRAAAVHAAPRIAEQLRRIANANETAVDMIRQAQGRTSS